LIKGNVSFDIPVWMLNEKLKLVEINGDENRALTVVRNGEKINIA
jgi:hypothetical protein